MAETCSGKESGTDFKGVSSGLRVSTVQILDPAYPLCDWSKLLTLSGQSGSPCVKGESGPSLPHGGLWESNENGFEVCLGWWRLTFQNSL